MGTRRDAGEHIDIRLVMTVPGNRDLGGVTVGQYRARLGAEELPRLEARPRRMTDEELDGVIGVLRQMEADEAIAPDQLEWAAANMHREGMLQARLPPSAASLDGTRSLVA